jgi:hypothetical protein
MIAPEVAVVYLKLQYLRAPNGTQRKTRIWIPWIPARDSNKEPSYFTDQTDVAVKLCICTRDAHISNQKGDLARVFLFSPLFCRQMTGFCFEEFYGRVISSEALRTHQWQHISLSVES